MTAFAVTDNLNWTVSSRAVATMNFQGEWVLDPEKRAIHRDDTDRCLGYVSPDYEMVQNQDLLNMINPLIQEGLLTVENMGYLSHGAKVFAQARINEEFRVIGEDYRVYITLLNGHIGNASVAIGPSAVRVICGNTFGMAYANIHEKFRHSLGVNEKMLESTSISEYVNKAMGKYSSQVEKLALTACSGSQFRKFLEETYNKEESKMRNIQVLNDLFYNGAGNEGRTFYDAFNAVTDFSSNRSRKTTSGRFNYANFGQGANINRRAMKVALEMATV
jgi:phage/plasmid-like protein (TIGR03299 family)